MLCPVKVVIEMDAHGWAPSSILEDLYLLLLPRKQPILQFLDCHEGQVPILQNESLTPLDPAQLGDICIHRQTVSERKEKKLISPSLPLSHQMSHVRTQPCRQDKPLISYSHTHTHTHTHTIPSSARQQPSFANCMMLLSLSNRDMRRGQKPPGTNGMR